MADRIADNADLAVDELRRKARRRLVGAIVLALAAAVILPLLLEKEPRPLGDDVSVQIPPVDEGKFINRLTGKAPDTKLPAKGDTKAAPKSEPASAETTPVAAPSADAAPPTAAASASGPSNVPPPKKNLAEAEQRVLSPATRTPAYVESKPDAKPTASAAVAAPPALKPEPEPAATSAPVSAPAKADGFVVQLAAYADDKGANALAGKLKRAGYAAYVEPVETSRGTLWRVRVGGYTSRPDVDAARAKLKAEGYNGIVAPAK